LKIRHRITHPKATSDVDVSDDELQTVEQAHFWFIESHTATYTEGRGALMAQLEIARQAIGRTSITEPIVPPPES